MTRSVNNRILDRKKIEPDDLVRAKEIELEELIEDLEVSTSANLVASNNLSDLTNISAAQQNLNLFDATNNALKIGSGAGAVLEATGLNNIAFGTNALNDATTADSCIAIGNEALAKITTVAGLGGLIGIGSNALAINTTGVYNCAIGLNVMSVNLDGSYNTGIGIEVLKDNTSGAKNLGLGAWALYENTVGHENAACGYAACFKQVGSVSSNTGIGSQALFENLTGQYNTAIGSRALLNNKGTGHVALGVYAGDNITTADRCIVMGYFIDTPSATSDYQLTIGNAIFGTNIDGLGTTISTGNIGICEPSPTAKLHVKQHQSAGAKPVLKLEQVDVSEEIIEFDCTIGVGNGIEAVGAKTLTTTHFIKVTLPGGLTRYIPCGTIA